MLKLQIILGSTRPGRNGKAVTNWVYDVAKKRSDIEVELVDIADYNLPLLDEPEFPMLQKYNQEHTKKWSQKISEADAFIFVTAEYNHSIPGALKNSLDYLYNEWANKAAGFVSYGVAGGVRAVEHLRGAMGKLQVADVKDQVAFYFDRDFENMHTFKPQVNHEQQLDSLIDSVIAWGEAMKGVREKSAQAMIGE